METGASNRADAIATMGSDSPSAERNVMSDPEIHCVHYIPGEVPSLVITGRRLWYGSEWLPEDQSRHSVTVNGVRGQIDKLFTASSQHPNRGLAVIQRVWFPAGLPTTATATVEYTRFDGAQSGIKTFLPVNRSQKPWIDSVTTEFISEPIIAGTGQTLDLGGRRFVPSSQFRGESLLLFGRGAVIRNGRFLIAESSKCPAQQIASPIRDPIPIPLSQGVHLEGLELIDARPRGVALHLRSSDSCFVAHCSLSAWICVNQEPNDMQRRNIYWRNRFTGPFLASDSQVGAIAGEENLVYGNIWEDIDRGPTGSPWGQPLSRTTWYGNVQRNTGRTQGASEGLLYESSLAWHGDAEIAGNTVRMIRFAGRSDVSRLRAGYFVMSQTPAAWARITRVVVDRGEVTVTTDRPLGDGSRYVGLGNAIAQNNFIGNRFCNGKAGLFFFGAQVDNVIAGNEFADLRGGIVSWVDQRPHEWSFSLGYTARANVFRSVEEPEVTIANTSQWPR
jgi:hypothetical protein